MRKIDFNFSPCVVLDIGKCLLSGSRFKEGVHHTFINHETGDDICADVNMTQELSH